MLPRAHLRAPQTGPPKHPSDSSTVVPYHCAVLRQEVAASDGKTALGAIPFKIRVLPTPAAYTHTLDAIAFRLELGEHHRHDGGRLRSVFEKESRKPPTGGKWDISRGSWV